MSRKKCVFVKEEVCPRCNTKNPFFQYTIFEKKCRKCGYTKKSGIKIQTKLDEEPKEDEENIY